MIQTYTDHDGNSLAYAEYGQPDGFPILVQHGLIASIRDGGLFSRLVDLGGRLICIARPGYGESAPQALHRYAGWADVVAPLVEALRLTSFDILGMSSGAPYGYALAARWPDRVRNVFVFSGMPALYDPTVLGLWPYKPVRDMSMDEARILAKELFFSNLTPEDLLNADIHDSLHNDAFGVAQDLLLRFQDWGFRLSDVQGLVFMHHSKSDDSVPYAAAVRTAELLPHCTLELTESGPHFSPEALNEFISGTIARHI
jgi:pimeloyl-ACP methyl ester carboxylesterase